MISAMWKLQTESRNLVLEMESTVKRGILQNMQNFP